MCELFGISSDQPLTDDGGWEIYKPGELLVARHGEVVTVMQSRGAERMGVVSQCRGG